MEKSKKAHKNARNEKAKELYGSNIEEFLIIERMYEDVRSDVEANTPDSYLSMSRSKKSSGTQPEISLSRLRGKKVHDAEEKIVAMAEKAAKRILAAAKFQASRSGTDQRFAEWR